MPGHTQLRRLRLRGVRVPANPNVLVSSLLLAMLSLRNPITRLRQRAEPRAHRTMERAVLTAAHQCVGRKDKFDPVPSLRRFANRVAQALTDRGGWGVRLLRAGCRA